MDNLFYISRFFPIFAGTLKFIAFMKKKLITTIILSAVCTICCITAFSQEFTPIVHLYDRGNYDSDNQNWSVSKSDDGTMYFGNGRGLLSYDGYRWELNRLPNGKIARSVMAGEGRVYVGSHEQFGYFGKTDNGTFAYHSLSSKLTDYQMQNDEIWRIFEFDGKVIFQSFTSFFVYDGLEIKAFKTPSVCLFFNMVGDRIFTSCDNFGLITIDICSGKAESVAGTPFKSQLVSVLKVAESSWLFITYSDGLYLYDGHSFRKFATELDEYLPLWQPNNAILSPDGDIIIGTKLKGAVCLDRNGREKWRIDSNNVLNSNTVLGMDFDMEGNLWLALDGGLAMAQIDSPLTYIHSITPSVGSVYTSFYRKPYLYIGTGQGLYRGRLDEDLKHLEDVKAINEVQSHVWSIEEFGKQIFCGTNYETFDIGGEKMSAISTVVGGSCIDRGIINGKDVLVQGTYTYPCVYVMRNGKWAFSHSLTDFMQPINSLEIDKYGTIWAGHQYKGLYAMTLGEDLSEIRSTRFYPTLDGKTERPVSVCSIEDRTVFLDGVTGYYVYDETSRNFVPYSELNDVLRNYPAARTICRFENNLYWFISPSQAVLVRIGDDGIQVEDVILYESLGNNISDENQSITPIVPHKCLIALGNSLALYEYRDNGAFIRSEPPVMSLSRVTISDMGHNKDSLAQIRDVETIRIPYKFRNVRIDWHAPHYCKDGDLRFRFKLDGGEWSDYSAVPSAYYPYMKKGKHQVTIQASRHFGQSVSENSISLRIATPFYLTTVAITLYCLAAVFLMVFSGYNIRRIRKEKVMEQEKRKLESEIKMKSKELAASTMSVIRNNELLNRIKEAIEDGKTDKAVSIIEKNLSGEQEWKTFESNFDNIHANFFRNLRERYPSLTDNDLRFCAYLRLNLSSKDIAALMNISLKGVEAARARIRKKIGIPSNCSLTTFMIELK